MAADEPRGKRREEKGVKPGRCEAELGSGQVHGWERRSEHRWTRRWEHRWMYR